MDEGRLMEFLHRFVVDFGATGAAGNVLAGEQLGLYRAMCGGPFDLVTSFDCLHDMGDPLGAAGQTDRAFRHAELGALHACRPSGAG
jgi:hypothetical protein